MSIGFFLFGRQLNVRDSDGDSVMVAAQDVIVAHETRPTYRPQIVLLCQGQEQTLKWVWLPHRQDQTHALKAEAFSI
jgi:hypothetical protein